MLGPPATGPELARPQLACLGRPPPRLTGAGVFGRRPRAQNSARSATSPVGDFKTDVPVQVRNRRESDVKGLGYGLRIERRVATSRLTYLPPRPVS